MKRSKKRLTYFLNVPKTLTQTTKDKSKRHNSRNKATKITTENLEEKKIDINVSSGAQRDTGFA